MFRDLKRIFLKKVKKRGGFVNCHAHFDRAFTINGQNLRLSQKLLKEKWALVDEIKRESTQLDFEARIEKAIKIMIKQGVKICATFVDVDKITGLKALRAAEKIKKKYKREIKFLLINQTLKGVIEKEARYWLEKALEYVDIIGGLPSRDRPYEEKHLNILCQYAKETGKMLHVHVGQENNPHEHDTELLAKKTIEYGLQGRVVAVHAISLAAQPPKTRKRVFQLMKKAKIGVICSPSAALSMKQLPYKSYLHNSIAPVSELLKEGIPVGLGVDNIADIYMPFGDGNLWTETRMLMEACRYYEIDPLVDIATTNGRKLLGIA